MTNFNLLSLNPKNMMLLLGTLVFLVSCGSYQNSSYYDDNDRRQVRVENNSNARVYKQYFQSVSEENTEIFTDVENDKTTNDTIIVVEKRNNSSWESNPTVVNVNVYDNSWGWNNWGIGWNNWRWNNWRWNNWGWNNWGWGGWYDPFWGPGWGIGWNYWGWNNWCAPSWGNNWHYGHALNTGRRPTSLIPQGGRAMNGRFLLNNDRSITDYGRTSTRFESDRTSGRLSRDNNGLATRPSTTPRPTSSREGRYDDSRVSNQPATRPVRAYTPSNDGSRIYSPSRSYEPSSPPSRTYSPSNSSPSRSSGGGSFGGGSMGGGSRGGGRGRG